MGPSDAKPNAHPDPSAALTSHRAERCPLLFSEPRGPALPDSCCLAVI